jgi:hypothetical protein
MQKHAGSIGEPGPANGENVESTSRPEQLTRDCKDMLADKQKAGACGSGGC